MTITLSAPAWRKVVDEDLAWLGNQPQSWERDHVVQCMLFLRKISPEVINDLYHETPCPAPGETDHSVDVLA